MWKTSEIASLVVAITVLLGVVLGVSAVMVNAFWGAAPTPDREKLLVEQWLKENLDDGQWEEVKWWPARTLQGLYDANLLHIVENMEKEKKSFERGLGREENNAECQKYYHKFRETGLRTFCAMKCRVTTLNGRDKALRSHVFEIVDGKAKPVAGNEIVEIPSSPFSQPVGFPLISYDGWRYFEEKDYDPFPHAPSNLEERAQAAMIWGPPAFAQDKARFPTPVEPPRQQIPSQERPPVAAPPESIPLKIREYFDRATEAKSAEVKKLETRIAGFESKIGVTKKIDQKIALKERIRQAQDTLAELKRSNGTAFLPDKPEVGDMGLFQAVEVMEVVDEVTLIVRWLPNGKGRAPRIDVVISPIETKDLKIGEAALDVDCFKVAATSDEQSEVLKQLRGAGRMAEFVAEPVEKHELEKWHDQYEKENQTKK